MQLKKETREIDGLSVTVQQFAVMRQAGLLTRLGKAMGPALGTLLDGGQFDLSADVGPALAAFFEKLEPEDTQVLLREILAGTSVIEQVSADVQRAVFLNTDESINRIFSGRILTIFAVARFALEVNFGDFFGALQPKLDAARANKSLSSSPQPSQP